MKENSVSNTAPRTPTLQKAVLDMFNGVLASAYPRDAIVFPQKLVLDMKVPVGLCST